MPWGRPTGLTVNVPGPVPDAETGIETVLTEEAAISPAAGEDLRVDVLVEEGARVAQGAPLFRLRHRPQIVFPAPMAGRVASVDLAPGRRLSEIRLFREDEAGRHRFDTGRAEGSADRLRALMLESGLWLALRARPFGRIPAPGMKPAAIFVMALDTRPHAPDPRRSVADRTVALEHGLAALARLTDGPLYLCEASGAPLFDGVATPDGTRVIRIRAIHPWGLPGLLVHAHHPATVSAPVCDIHVEDVAAIGTLLREGMTPRTRLVAVAGPALDDARLVRCQPGADLRGLTYGYARPGTSVLLSGSALDGRRARWLGLRDRQVTVDASHPDHRGGHWLLSALQRASRPLPVIPTAALERALGGAIPAMALLRALAVGDRETAVQLGALSLIGEDLTLADYVTGAEPRHSALLTRILADIAEEEAP